MKISKIRIEQFRRFRQPIEIDDLGAGINLFVGPNEAGKSSVAEAIRVAFFERHRSNSAEPLRPWGDSSASPAVDITFEIGGQPAVLHKRFLQRKHCDLRIGGQTFEGGQAEDHLAELLGFGFAGKGASNPMHQGIPGLLWIEQGRAQELDKAVEYAGEYLQRALGAALGGLASSAGDSVLEQAEAARNALLTEAQGRPRGEYGDAVKQEDALREEFGRTEGEVRAYRERVDQLEKLRGEHARDTLDMPWVQLREQEQQARSGLAEVDRLRQAVEDAQRQRRQIEERRELYREQIQNFDAQSAQFEARRIGLEDAKLQLKSAQATRASCRAQHVQALAASESARQKLALARQEGTRRALEDRSRELKRQMERATESLRQAEIEQEALGVARASAIAHALTDDDLAALREQRTKMREFQARQQAVATRLRYRLDPGREMTVGSRAYSGDGEALIVDTTELLLPGFGALELIPGVTDLAEVARELQELATEHEGVLRRLGLVSLEEAEIRYLRHRDLLSEVKLRSGKLNLLAPDGVDALRVGLGELQARERVCRAELDALPAAPADVASLPGVAEAETAEHAARVEFDRAAAALNRVELLVSQAVVAQENALAELQASEAVIKAPDRSARLKQAQDGLTDAAAELATLERRVNEIQQRIDVVQPELLAQDAQRCAASAAAMEAAYAERRVRIGRLEAELETLGAQGLEEQCADLARGGCRNFCVRGAGRLVHGGGRRLRRTERRGGQVGGHLTQWVW